MICRGVKIPSSVPQWAPLLLKLGIQCLFTINLILGCREEKAHLQCCLKTHLQIVGGGDDRVFQPKGDPGRTALKSQECVAFSSKPTDKVPAFLPWH